METLYIKHHGIQGMKWGQRNGPPYPLKPGARSAAEKKAAGGAGKTVTKKIKFGGVKDMTLDELKAANAKAGAEAQYAKNQASQSKGMSNNRPASDMTTAELQAYNTRRQAEDQYKDFQKKDKEKAIEKKTENLRAARDLAKSTEDVNRYMKKAVEDYYDSKHKKEKASVDLSTISDDELRRRINRMDLERRYRDLIPTEVSRGERTVRKIFDTSSSVLNMASTGLDIAVKVKSLLD